jgi:hypothetical protein
VEPSDVITEIRNTGFQGQGFTSAFAIAPITEDEHHLKGTGSRLSPERSFQFQELLDISSGAGHEPGNPHRAVCLGRIEEKLLRHACILGIIT